MWPANMRIHASFVIESGMQAKQHSSAVIVGIDKDENGKSRVMLLSGSPVDKHEQPLVRS